MSETRFFIEPLDVLFLRGNKLFGDAGSFGESLVPPWPSVAAGALRSALLVSKKHDPVKFALGRLTGDAEIGTPTQPGSFTVTAFQLARRLENGKVEPLFSLPADLVACKHEGRAIETRRIMPHEAANGVLSSASTKRLAVLSEKQRAKPASGLWLTTEGWECYLKGQTIDASKHLVESRNLWGIDTRVGVGLDRERRRAAEGKLFTVQAVALRKQEQAGLAPPRCDAGFLAAVTGCVLPERFALRLGGDGRGALAHRTEAILTEPNYEAISRAGTCRLILTTPGVFVDGWRPTGTTGTGRDLRFNLHGVKARLTCAAVPRAEVISGFDIASWKPKPAQRFAPVGSVYWLEELDATPHSLRKLAESGLWSDPPENASRRAEGFNRCTIATY
jgi:CRISPR-associated protein Cmr3